MKQFLPLTLLMLFVAPIAVCADEASSDPVPANLVILGKGMLNKRTKESIAVACMEPQLNAEGETGCKYLRAVRFDQNRNPSWLTGPIHIDVKSFAKKLRKLYREEYRAKFGRINYKTVKEDHWRLMNSTKVVAIGGFTFGVLDFVLWQSGVGIPADLGLKVVLVCMGWIFGAELFDSITGIDPLAFLLNAGVVGTELFVNGVTAPVRGVGNIIANRKANTSTMTAQDGWNWSEEPKRVRNAKYERLVRVLKVLAEDIPSKAEERNAMKQEPEKQERVVLPSSPELNLDPYSMDEQDRVCAVNAQSDILLGLKEYGAIKIIRLSFVMHDRKWINYVVEAETNPGEPRWFNIFTKRTNCNYLGHSVLQAVHYESIVKKEIKLN